MSQFGIIVNVDKCIGCQACFVACKEENKVAPGPHHQLFPRELPALRQSGLPAGLPC